MVIIGAYFLFQWLHLEEISWLCGRLVLTVNLLSPCHIPFDLCLVGWGARVQQNGAACVCLSKKMYELVYTKHIIFLSTYNNDWQEKYPGTSYECNLLQMAVSFSHYLYTQRHFPLLLWSFPLFAFFLHIIYYAHICKHIRLRCTAQVGEKYYGIDNRKRIQEERQVIPPP